MHTCSECGEQLCHSERRLRVFTAGGSPLGVDADECPRCGRMFPREGAIEGAIARREAPTVVPPRFAAR